MNKILVNISQAIKVAISVATLAGQENNDASK
jgi:hypothetical protein